MTAQVTSRRRDQRHVLRPGSAIVEFANPESEGARWRGRLERISVAGLRFVVDEPEETLRAGMLLVNAKLVVGDCELAGDIAVRNCRPLGDGRTEVGALFYAASPEIESRLMCVIAGIEAAATE